MKVRQFVDSRHNANKPKQHLYPRAIPGQSSAECCRVLDFINASRIGNIVTTLIILDNSYLHLMTQFYRSVEKVLGLETVDEGKAGQGHHREVTWPQFVQYLLKTSPQRDVSEFVVYIFF